MNKKKLAKWLIKFLDVKEVSLGYYNRVQLYLYLGWWFCPFPSDKVVKFYCAVKGFKKTKYFCMWKDCKEGHIAPFIPSPPRPDFREHMNRLLTHLAAQRNLQILNGP